jgi:DnaK suppressor protein
LEEALEPLTGAEEAQLKSRLLELKSELDALLVATEADVQPVDLDTPIGRLSRMDAMQQQQMAQANRKQHQLRLAQIQSALAALAREEYGYCRKCEEPIGFPRLKARPETPFCRSCQGAIENKS